MPFNEYIELPANVQKEIWKNQKAGKSVTEMANIIAH